ncbi:MAG: SDR family NAD(P)-dependent oxidoreductase, partial [Cyanobacteria bacterium P01_E01_bin.35]
MNQTFVGQKIIIVGGTSGIGKEIARSLLSAGVTAVLIGSREAKLKDAVNELSQYGTVFGELANISDVQQRNV